jgi:hypothetical protein
MKEQVSRPLEVGNQALAQEVQRLHGEVENLKQDLVAKERQLGELGHQLGEKDNRIEKLEEKLHKALERIERLEEELRRKKKLKGKPLLRESALGQKTDSEPEGQRPGSKKRSKKQGFAIDRHIEVEPEKIPPGSHANGSREYDVQEIEIERRNIRFYLKEYVTPEGTIVVGQVPVEYRRNGHFGPNLVSYILYQYYQNRVTQPLIVEELKEFGIALSAGQINQILTHKAAMFAPEQQQVLQVALSVSGYIHTDDTGARHQGKNGFCTVVGNHWFTYFRSSFSKSRVNFLETLQGGASQYLLNEYSCTYLEMQQLSSKHLNRLSFGEEVIATDWVSWHTYLDTMGIVSKTARRLVSEAALLGGLLAAGLSESLRILSDGAPQFDLVLLLHGLCWVHQERVFRRLNAPTADDQSRVEAVQSLIWDYYRQLLDYQKNPSPQEQQRLWVHFDEVFGFCPLHYPSLSNALNELRKHKAQLLCVLGYSDLPLHNNEAESDIREFVTRDKISGGTRSDIGRRARDALVGLKKTCRKLEISFWAFILSRVRGDQSVPHIPDVLRQKVIQQQGALAASTA